MFVMQLLDDPADLSHYSLKAVGYFLKGPGNWITLADGADTIPLHKPDSDHIIIIERKSA